MFITNPQISVHCRTHPHPGFQYMLKKPSRTLNFRLRRLCSDNSDYFNKVTEMCQFFKNVAILPLLYCRAFSAPKRSIASQHSKRRRSKRMREFHSPLLFTPTILLSKTSSSKILNHPRTTTKLPLSSHNLHSPHTNVTKT